MRTKGNALELTCKILWTKFTIPIALPLPPIVFNSADSFSDILLLKGSLRIGDSTFVKLPFVTFCCTPIELFSWKSDHLNLDDRGYNEYQQFEIGFWIIPSEKLTLRIQLHFASLARYVCHPKGAPEWSEPVVRWWSDRFHYQPGWKTGPVSAGFCKDDFWSHRTVPWLYVFSFQEENEIMSVLNWNDHLLFQSVGLFTLSKCTQCMNSVLDFVKISFRYRRMFVILLNQSNL